MHRSCRRAPLDAAEIAAAAEEEAASYRRLFGASPEVAVPTTFVWNGDVERAWKKRRRGGRHHARPARDLPRRCRASSPASIGGC